MRQVTLTAHVPAAQAGPVFDTLADFGRYPDHTDAVREVVVRQAEGGALDSDWAVNFRNGVLRWSERDVVDAGERTITFAQTEGDFDRFDGAWRVEQVDGDVVIRFEAEFDLGMPSLAPLIDPIAARTLVENLQRILVGLTGPATTFSGG
ncbi:type II toxin-antitoxin system RatA family toxin [Nonomuraea sediminis]|uniref:type II toxin-antitoxin system RatA family toxin n=1 Tax=Nonomuraea sediminis TaxID=2835864 RepID=UPI001BDD1E11|nr:SRPBCC family protein [Nonomuraea sediminis]